ncbi:hypothetical protein CI1B_21780 [Bradyrhizobium ivorense]|uniref:Uncharacterized protein n=1 Tax=Bradyrhizobium ivorense TaxID=2511166 RepID=A0A508T314_9BRAD|nr:hypothetical protein [Bradyrhizobium ivorense]VIO68556.1 hypothetical protein CI1B_21780 [Bradyrhizobium ivorense]
MRKLVLMSAFVLASVVTAEAGQSRSLVLAAHDTPAPAAETAPAANPQAVQAQQVEAPQVQAPQVQPQAASAEQPKQQAAKPAKRSYARRRESDEAKARRIAARYGVYW